MKIQCRGVIFRVDGDRRRASTDSVFLSGDCDVVRSFVQEGKFVARFTTVVSSDSSLIAAVWNGA